MPRGGHGRSGPAPQENSGRSERRGYTLTALPSEGYDGPTPEWPLPDQSAREVELWAWAWRTPQACAWSMPSEAWRVRTVALWCRMTVRCEADDAPAALLGQLHRFADQIGMTTAGLREMGWKVAVDAVAEKRAERDSEPEPVKTSSRDRMSLASGGSGG